MNTGGPRPRRPGDAPVRLLLGADAVPMARQEAQELAAGDEAWREFSLSVSDGTPRTADALKNLGVDAAPTPSRRDALAGGPDAEPRRAAPTLTGGSDLRMILRSGLQYTTRAQYVDFHRQWFASNDNGRFDPEIVHLVESPRLGHALIKLRYRSRAPTGAIQDIVSWLALTFALEDGGWRLVFDQSTLIQPSP